ncbi:hypothetical protein NDU88_004201, partial [Pleurodeles waltl]
SDSTPGFTPRSHFPFVCLTSVLPCPPPRSESDRAALFAPRSPMKGPSRAARVRLCRRPEPCRHFLEVWCRGGQRPPLNDYCNQVPPPSSAPRLLSHYWN